MSGRRARADRGSTPPRVRARDRKLLRAQLACHHCGRSRFLGVMAELDDACAAFPHVPEARAMLHQLRGLRNEVPQDGLVAFCPECDRLTAFEGSDDMARELLGSR